MRAGSLDGAAPSGTSFDGGEFKPIDASSCKIFTCLGCNGGLMDYDYAFAEQQFHSNRRRLRAVSLHRAHPHDEVVGCTDVSIVNEQAVMPGTPQQSVSIVAETEQSSFQFYSSTLLTASFSTASVGSKGFFLDAVKYSCEESDTVTSLVGESNLQKRSCESSDNLEYAGLGAETCQPVSFASERDHSWFNRTCQRKAA